MTTPKNSRRLHPRIDPVLSMRVRAEAKMRGESISRLVQRALLQFLAGDDPASPAERPSSWGERERSLRRAYALIAFIGFGAFFFLGLAVGVRI